MGTPVRPEYIPHTYKDPLGIGTEGSAWSLEVQSLGSQCRVLSLG